MFDPHEALPTNDESENPNERIQTPSNGQAHESERPYRIASMKSSSENVKGLPLKSTNPVNFLSPNRT